jgi:alkyl hydroperoxide reductase subunit AhpF
MVAAADLGKSTFMHSHSLTGVDRDFDKLEFKDKLRTDPLLFRLAESSNALVVHEKVKKAIEKSKIEGVVFYDSGEWSG